MLVVIVTIRLNVFRLGRSGDKESVCGGLALSELKCQRGIPGRLLDPHRCLHPEFQKL